MVIQSVREAAELVEVWASRTRKCRNTNMIYSGKYMYIYIYSVYIYICIYEIHSCIEIQVCSDIHGSLNWTYMFLLLLSSAQSLMAGKQWMKGLEHHLISLQNPLSSLSTGLPDFFIGLPFPGSRIELQPYIA